MDQQNEYGICKGTERRTHTENQYPTTAMFRKYPDALRLSDLADMLGISTKLASRLIRDGEIPAVRVGRKFACGEFQEFAPRPLTRVQGRQIERGEIFVGKAKRVCCVRKSEPEWVD